MAKSLEVASVQDQHLTIHATTTRPDHLEFVYRHFFEKPDSSLYAASLKHETHPDQPADYFRFLTSVAAQEAQFGSDYLKEPVQAHIDKRYKVPYFDPRHLLARACELGSLNVQAYHIKKDVIEKLKALDAEVAPKIWQIGLSLEGNKVLDSRINRPLEDLVAIMSYWPVRSPIFLTDLDLNMRLAGFQFTAQDADAMPLDIFARRVVPLAQERLGDILDLGKAVEGFRPV